jgi:hypothetical protein
MKRRISRGGTAAFLFVLLVAWRRAGSAVEKRRKFAERGMRLRFRIRNRVDSIRLKARARAINFRRWRHCASLKFAWHTRLFTAYARANSRKNERSNPA